MRACVDTNILTSYLIAPPSDNLLSNIVRGALRGAFTLVVAELTLTELSRRVQSKPYLVDRISIAMLNQFVASLREIAEVYPLPSDPLPRVVRDPRDDYLLAPAVLEQVDYLVSGDNDLLDLGAFQGVRMVSPREFVDILDASPGLA
ncbi:MAG TPA: putative toxin-antitoxin system toxin component, PIN family [Thermomicrobiales bacterium]|nr:putative toxin-antitoxin system toxin component, PIN family [Thermomicrobiales bacterium]